MVKIFDQAVARTGLRDHEAAAAGFDPVTVGSEADDHKAYYPGSHRIAMRFTGDRTTGRLLGLQLFGHRHAEIAKRIDIAATAIFHGMTVDAMSDLDLSYTPPLGAPGTPSRWAHRPGSAQPPTPNRSHFQQGKPTRQRRTASPHQLSHSDRHPQCGSCDHRAHPGRLHDPPGRTSTSPAAPGTTAAAASSPDRFVQLGSAAPGDLDGDVCGFDGGDCEHSWLQAEFVGGFTAEQ